MGGKRRDRAAEQAAVTAAAERLLAATPLRSETGKLTVSELITESALRRDIVYEHPQLIDTFKARAKARDAKPAALTALAGERDELRSQLTAAREELANQHRSSSTLRKVIAELSLELDQAREELTALSNVTPLRPARDRETDTTADAFSDP
jgi:regulator of protease activity HflC (stomatin/prohibitin superfamily)